MRSNTKKGWFIAGTLGAVTCLAFSPLFGQDKPKATAEKPAKEAAKPDAKPAKSTAARLPSYYGEVVDKEQREKIYKIQEEFAVKRDELAAQLKALTAKRDADVKAVLTPEQLKKVAELEAAGDAKAKAAREARAKVETPKEAAKAAPAEEAKPATPKKPAAKP